MREPIFTTVSFTHRTITQHLADGKTARYALSRSTNGDVSWRQDTFAAADRVVHPLRWLSHQGPLTVADVVAAVADRQRSVRAWTEMEIDQGPSDATLDAFAQQRRALALIRLRDELQAAESNDSPAARPRPGGLSSDRPA